MTTCAFAIPILPGKSEEWPKRMNELTGARHEKLVESRCKAGFHCEQASLWRTPQGELAVVDCDDPVAVMQKLLDHSELNVWFKGEAQRILGVHLSSRLVEMGGLLP